MHAMAEITEYVTPLFVTHPDPIPVGPDILLQDETTVSLLTAVTPTVGSTSRIFISSSLKDKHIAIQFDQTRTLIIEEKDLRTRMSLHIYDHLQIVLRRLKTETCQSNSSSTLRTVYSTNAYHRRIRSLSLLREVLGATLPALQQRSTEEAKDVEKCRYQGSIARDELAS